MKHCTFSTWAGGFRALALLTLVWTGGLQTAEAQPTVFTYQGRVRVSGTDFNGMGQFKFALVTSTNVSRQATATANRAGQFVVSYNVTFGGNGYVTPPAVTVSGGGGSGATAHAVISGGMVTSVEPDSAGSGYTSAPTVTIAPPPPSISFTTFWSNDETSVAGSEPAAAVSVPVSNGLFTIVLGDTTLVNMASIDAGVFVQPNLQLRIWFSDGVNPFGVLNPPQNLTPTPYAIIAGSLSGPLASSSLSGTYSGSVSFNNNSNTFNGSFTGNGGGLSNVSANALVVIRTNISITSWGDNQFHQRVVPPGLDNVVAVSGGFTHSLALKADGTVVAWGAGEISDTNSPADVPPGLNAVAISAGYLHSLAVRADGTVVAWGRNNEGQTNVPPGLNNVIAASAGLFHNVALKSDGTVVAWGTNSNGQLSIPLGLNSVVAVTAGYAHNLALRANGTVVAWGAGQTNSGENLDFGQSIVPPGLANVVGIAVGAIHSVAVKADGTVVAWGGGHTNDPGSGFHYGQSIVPPGLGNVIAVAAGLVHGLALKSDGTVVAWGGSGLGETNVPAGLNNVVALAPGSTARHVLALRTRAQAPVAVLDSDNTFNGSVEVNGDLSTSGDLTLNDGNIWFRGVTDRNNGLGWYGASKDFSDFALDDPDGPVLFGSRGGALATSSNGQQRVALFWDASRRVGIGTTSPGAKLSLGNDEAATKLLVYDAGSGLGVGLGVSNSQFRLHLGSGASRFAFLDSASGGNELLSIFSGGGLFNGRVGIGTNSPQAKLHVHGDIRMGPRGHFPAGSAENLRIIRGVVTAAGGRLEGTDFTVAHPAVGVYDLTFSPPFSAGFLPTVTATAQSGIARIATVTNVGSSGAGIRTFDANGAAVDVQFNFIAIGP